MGDHERREVAFSDDAAGEVGDELGTLGVECGGVLVEEHDLGLREASHEQRERLALAAGEQTDASREAIVQTELQLGQFLLEEGAAAAIQSEAEPAGLAALVGHRKVLFDSEVRRGTRHGVLEDATHDLRALMLGKAGDICTSDGDSARVDGQAAGDGIKERRLARAVGTDDGHEVAGLQVQIDARERAAFVDGAGEEGLGNALNLKHET